MTTPDTTVHSIVFREIYLAGEPHWQAHCVCGWSSKPRLSERAAHHDGGDHLAEMAQANG